MVEVEVNGLAEVLAVRIDPSLVEKGDREMIEDLLPAAFNAAQQKAKEMHSRGPGRNHRRYAGLQDALSSMGLELPTEPRIVSQS